MRSVFVVALISLMIISDILTSLAFNLNLSFWNFGILIKTPVEFLFLILIARYRRFHYLYAVIAILLVFWLAGISTTLFRYGSNFAGTANGNFLVGEDGSNLFFASFTVFSRYILFFALMPILWAHCKDERFSKRCKQIFEWFLYANSIAIILGYVFHFSIFSSYNPTGEDLTYEARFGYKGLLYGINEVTGIYFLGIAHAYRELFVFRKMKIYLLLLLLVAASLTGAKGCILVILILSTYYFFMYRRGWFYIFIVPLILIGTVYAVNTNLVENLSSLLNIYLTLEDATPLGAFLTFFMTGRNLYISENWLYMEAHWNFLNYIVGDGVLYSETDFFDLYYFFGIGLFFYLFAYAKLVFYKTQPELKYVFAFLLLMAATGGHIIRSGVFPIFFCLFLISGYSKKSLEYQKLRPLVL